MGYAVGFVAIETWHTDPDEKRAALENVLDAWAQLCREGPAFGLYEFLLPIDDQLYWFVNRRDPVAHEQFRELPEDRILKDCPSTDQSDGILIGRMGLWSTLRQEIESAQAKRGVECTFPTDPSELIHFWAPDELATRTLYFFREPYLDAESWAIHPNTAIRVDYDYTYNAKGWPDYFKEWRDGFGSEDEDFIRYLEFTREWLQSHKLLFGTEYNSPGLASGDETDLPPLYPVPKLRLDPSGTKALPPGSE